MTLYQVGNIIANQYQVTRVYEGGMGIAYVCQTVDVPHRMVVIKTVKEPTLERRRLFQREAATWLRLEPHPNIVGAYQYFVLGDEPCVLAEAVVDSQGQSVSLRTTHGWMGTPTAAVWIAVQIARGMEHATHQLPDLVHCDLKPENVLVTQEGVCRITDFGLARAALAAEGFAGTCAYMGPEQLAGQSLDCRSDIFALGCIAFEALTGRQFRPVRNRAEAQSRPFQILTPSELSAVAPPALAEWLSVCLCPDPAGRYADWGRVRTAIEQVAADLGIEVPPPAKLSPLPPEFLFTRGFSFSQLGMMEEAWADCKVLRTSHPTLLFGMILESQLLIIGGRYSEARAILEQEWLRQEPENPMALFMHAISLSAVGQENGSLDIDLCDRALQSIESALRIAPGFADAWAMRAFLRWTRSFSTRGTERDDRLEHLICCPEPDVAQLILEDIARAESLNPAIVETSTQVLPIKLLALHVVAPTDVVLAAVTEACRRYPGKIDFWRQRAVLLLELNRASEAQEALDRAYAIDPLDIMLIPIQQRANKLHFAHLPRPQSDDHKEILRSWEERLRQMTPRDFELWRMARSEHLIEPVDSHNLSNLLERANKSLQEDRFSDALALCDDALRIDSWHNGALLLRGRALVNLERYQEAMICIDRCCRRYPNDPDASIDMGWALLRAGFPDAAIARLMPLRDTHPKLNQLDQALECAYIKRAQQHRDVGRIDDALADLCWSITRNPDPRSAPYLLRALVLIELGRGDEALADLDQVLQHIPDHIEALMLRAQTAALMGRSSDAHETANRLVSVAPEDPATNYTHTLISTSLFNFNVGDADAVLRAFEETASHESAPAPLYMERAYFALRLGRVDIAREDCARALTHDPDLPAALIIRAAVALLAGAVESAHADLARASRGPRRIEPIYYAALHALYSGMVAGTLENYALRDAEFARTRELTSQLLPAQAIAIIAQLSQALIEQNDYTTALQVVEDGWSRTEDLPSEADALLLALRAGPLIGLGRIDEALAATEHARRLSGTNPALLAQALMYRAQALTMTEQYAEALEAINDVLARFPEFPVALLTRAQILMLGFQNPEEALGIIDSVLGKTPAIPMGWIFRGMACAMLSHFDEGIASYTRALALSPSTAVAYIGRAELYAHLAHLEEALEDITAALVIDPDNPTALAHHSIILAQGNHVHDAESVLTRAREQDSSLPIIAYAQAILALAKNDILTALHYLTVAEQRGLPQAGVLRAQVMLSLDETEAETAEMRLQQAGEHLQMATSLDEVEAIITAFPMLGSPQILDSLKEYLQTGEILLEERTQLTRLFNWLHIIIKRISE